MADYSPELIQTMQAVLDEVTSKIPLGPAAQSIKAQVAECILKAAAEGQTTYDGLLIVASDRIQTIISLLA